MLSHIYVKNFGLIREIDTDLTEGLNIITGETGTGKSMIIQALNVALGSRGSASMITDGETRALVQLVFILDPSEQEMLGRYIPTEGDREIILTRELSSSGRNLARINGEIVKVFPGSGAPYRNSGQFRRKGTAPFKRRAPSGIQDLHGKTDLSPPIPQRYQ